MFLKHILWDGLSAAYAGEIFHWLQWQKDQSLKQAHATQCVSFSFLSFLVKFAKSLERRQ